MMNMRLQKLVQQLMKTKELQTSDELAAFIRMTSKTVQKDLKELNELLNNDIAYIESIRGKGYRLNIVQENKFKKFLEQETKQDNRYIPKTRVERALFLMEKLLLQNTYIKIDDLADEIFVSRSTLQNDLNEVRKRLKYYQLYIDQKPGYGIKICGDEMNIRFCISEYIFNKKNMFKVMEILQDDKKKLIENVILSKLKKYEIVITDISLYNLITHIVIASKRIDENELVEIKTEELVDIYTTKEYKIAKDIVLDLEKQLNISFPSEEIAYLTIHLQGMKNTYSNSMKNEMKLILDESIQNLTEKILEELDKLYSLNLLEDEELFFALSLHLKPAITRYKYDMNIRNPLLEEIKNKYPYSYEIALTTCSDVIKKSFGITINENEIGYIALHIQAALERQKINNNIKKNCLIICASGLGTSKLLLVKLKEQFDSDLNILGTTEYHNLENKNLEKIDIIVSTIPIAKKLPVPVIQVSTLLGKKDINNIKKVMYNDIEVAENYVRKEFTSLKMNFTSKEDVIKFLGEKLINANLVNNDYINSVLERESYSSTSFGNMVAIPHPMNSQTKESFWSILTLRNPILWGNKPVQFVCLLNIGTDSKMKNLEKMYDLLVNLLDDKETVQKLLQCDTFVEFKKIIRDF